MPIGTLKTYVADRGWGLIHPRDRGPFVFFHFKELDLNPTELVVGDLLQYEIGTGPDGRPRAVRVRWAQD